MGTFPYIDHAIIAGAKRDEISGKYKPIAHIGWRAPDGKRCVHSFSLAERYARFEDASLAAGEAAKLWVDVRLSSGFTTERRRRVLGGNDIDGNEQERQK